MGSPRKDLRGRVLRKGESQRKSDKRYTYIYRDAMGTRKTIYANDLVTLREREEEIQSDLRDGMNIYLKGRATVNQVFDRYISVKSHLKDSTKANYTYMYNHFIRESFGSRKIGDICYSDVYQFYNYLLDEEELSLNTLTNIHSLLHPTFNLAVRDNVIRNNPSDGVIAEISKESGKNTGVRHALTPEQQKAFMEYISLHPVYCHWWPLFTVLLGTGTRIGECLGLRWDDVDFDKRIISINHSLVYYPDSKTRKSYMRISTPKTEAGTRTIPLLDVVQDAFELVQEEERYKKSPDYELDGFKNFVFFNRFGGLMNPQSVNGAIKRIVETYNAEEQLEAKREKREPELLPDFSCHVLRHTFATRLCETETNLKVIQSIMGHKNIQTTMDIYAECTRQKKEESFDNLAVKLDKLF